MALFTAIKTRLNKELRDADNATFTDDEKSEALTRAVEDDRVCIIEEVNNVVFVNGTRNYPLAANVRAVYSIGLDISVTGSPQPLNAEAYSFVTPNLTFSRQYVSGIPTNSVLYITQLRKLTISDDIPDYLVPYVLNMAIYYTVEMLASGKVNRFLRNDTTLGEIMQRGQMALQNANRLKKALPTQRYVAV